MFALGQEILPMPEVAIRGRSALMLFRVPVGRAWIPAVRRSVDAAQDSSGPSPGLWGAPIWLWLLDGNERARRLYQRFGFQSTNERQELPDHPAGTEERMRLRLN
jgi:hypothetical protein